MKCRTCGTTLTAGALLCGECGTSAIAPRPTLGDTERYDRRALLDAIAREASAPGVSSAAASPVRPSQPPVAGAVPVDALPSAAREAATADHSAVGAEPAEETVLLEPSVLENSVLENSVLENSVLENSVLENSVLEPSALARSGPLFSLVFSTGESIRVSGRGLIGRNPEPREGESVDYLVQIVDPERSVSKTHLEFGVDGDRLWIADRGSANGTRFGLDLVEPIDLVPGDRMRVPRGTRVGIGDQYFDVH